MKLYVNWHAVGVRNQKAARQLRQRLAIKAKRKSIPRVHLNNAQKWLHQRLRLAVEDTAACKRRAILIHPDGCVSPMRLLSHTNNKRGVVGSLLGGVPVVVAHNKQTNLVAMGLQDSVCDDKWEVGGDAHDVLRSSCMQIQDTASDGVYGMVLLVRLRQCVYTGRIEVADLPLHRDVYHHAQVEAPDDNSCTEDAEVTDELVE